MALHNFHDGNRTFAIGRSGGRNNYDWTGNKSTDCNLFNWRGFILPFIDEQPLYDSRKAFMKSQGQEETISDHDSTWRSAFQNAPFRLAAISMLRCPIDPSDFRSDVDEAHSWPLNRGNVGTVSSYFASAGPKGMYNATSAPCSVVG